MAEPWWNATPLGELSASQWEALCDGCGKCCLHKLEDEDSGEVLYTRVHCGYLDEDSCQCSDYANRLRVVPECVRLTPDNIGALDWLPGTCAYRLRAHGQALPAWHPLVSGSRDSVHRAGVSIRGRAISDEYVHPDGYDEHIITWVE